MMNCFVLVLRFLVGYRYAVVAKNKEQMKASRAAMRSQYVK